MDSSRLRTGEIVAGIGGIALFVFLFFDWFGAGIEGFDGGVSGWDGLGLDFSGFIVALSSFAGVALALLALSGQKVNVPLPRGSVTAVLGLLSVAIIVWRIFANPGDLKVGLFLGLIAAIAIAAGALMALREDGYEPLVPVPGGDKRAAAASAPAAPPPTAETPPSGATGASGGATRSSGARTTRRAPAKKPAARSTAKSGSQSRSGTSKSRSSTKPGGSWSASAKRSSSGGRK